MFSRVGSAAGPGSRAHTAASERRLRYAFCVSGIVLAGLTVLICTSPAFAVDDWKFSLTPYIWLPTIKGQLNFDVPTGGPGSPNVEAGPSDYLSDINSALMLAGEARMGRWSLLGDLIYLDIDGAKARTVSVNLPGGGTVPVIDTGSETSLRGTLVTLAPGYSVYSTPLANMDVFGGLRYLTVKAVVDWRINAAVGAFPATGSTEQDRHITDGKIGVRSQFFLILVLDMR